MNILFFSRLFYPHIGGVERHVLEVSKSLIKRGHKISVVAEQNSQKEKTNEIFEGIRIFRIPNLKEGRFKKFKIWKWLLSNRYLIEEADVVHCHDVFFWYLPFRFIFPSKKIFTTFHGYEGFPLKQKDIMIHKISEKLSKGNICIGDFIKKWYGTKPTYVSYGATKIQNSKFKIQNKIEKESALFIGRLDEQTGILEYAKAVRIIKKKFPNFKFGIIGDGKFREELEREFDVLGLKKNPEKYFHKYNFAFVSRYLSILEAMAAKRLVFAVYDNLLKEDYLKLAPFSKYINISGSVAQLISQILFYLENENKRDKLVDDAYNWARKQTWKKVVRKYLLLWSK